ncbi:MAG: phosphoenolpyruvate--protein phosphotransferase [Synergistaceae bacterium]|jgi:phosphotransferase system enzyme I (PtsI)|nr:phosphoenolpyruvate--protein phosphotransferase [Synergistaceae bacterium]
MKKMKGLCGSPGYGIGTAVIWKNTTTKPPRYAVDDRATEETRLKRAREACDARLCELEEKTAAEVGEAEAEIFSAHRMILSDETFFENALARVEPERLNIEYLIYDECRKVVATFAELDDAYLKERAADIENVCNDVIRRLLGESAPSAPNAGTDVEDVILVAGNLTPEETVRMDKTKLRGFVTEKGGITSHAVILAKAMGLPAIVGLPGALENVAPQDKVLIDGFTGEVIIQPDEEAYKAFLGKYEKWKKLESQYELASCLHSETRDGFHVDVDVNVGDAWSIRDFDAKKCDGIGLFRTEFIYMGVSDYPGEDVQYEIYKDIASRASGKEVIIRTLDVGGDKQLEYMGLRKESNPFLGCRAIRLCLARPDIFNTQLRAILRASSHGNVKVMFPMIANLEEVRLAKECLEKAKRSLREEGAVFDENIPVGIMVETPAAVFISDQLAQAVDFFSVGSNDLIQYITAADRMNESVQHLYDSCNLSVLRSMREVSRSAAACGIPWGICGEVASEERLVPLWVALGVSELSVAPSQVGKIKQLVRRMDRKTLEPEMERILDMDSIAGARDALDAILENLP